MGKCNGSFVSNPGVSQDELPPSPATEMDEELQDSSPEPAVPTVGNDATLGPDPAPFTGTGRSTGWGG